MGRKDSSGLRIDGKVYNECKRLRIRSLKVKAVRILAVDPFKMATVIKEQQTHTGDYSEIFDQDPPVEIIHTVSLVVRQPTLEYSEDKFDLTTSVKPLRGIFLNLLAFLTPVLPVSNNVVVIYNCPAVIIDALSKFFPDVEWKVVVEEVRSTRPGKIRYMTEKKVFEEGGDVILISLRRSAFYNKTLYDKYRVKYAFLSFPMHFRDEKTLFLDGTVYVPVYSPHFSFDFYLVPNGKMRIYDSNLLKSKAYSFHIDYRSRLYPVRYEVPDLDNCFDCTIETAICEMYIFGVKKIFPKNDNVNELILSYSGLFREDK